MSIRHSQDALDVLQDLQHEVDAANALWQRAMDAPIGTGKYESLTEETYHAWLRISEDLDEKLAGVFRILGGKLEADPLHDGTGDFLRIPRARLDDDGADAALDLYRDRGVA